MNILVIYERDHEDDEKIVIGVAESVEIAEKMIKEYYGEENYTEISKTDIRDSSLEYSKVLELNHVYLLNTYKVTITLEWFKLNEL